MVPLPKPAPDGNPRSCSASGPVVEALLDNVRSTFNVGAMFRTADGAGVAHLHLGGVTPTPEHPRVGKTALGAEHAVPWTWHPNALEAAQAGQARGLRLWALEVGPGAVALPDVRTVITAEPVLLVVGGEVSGVDPAILALCEYTLWIPMQGFKRTLNVAIAFGIAVYGLRYAT
jgi:tRNA G18 (ribose-2'-O)-methylase SpoU